MATLSIQLTNPGIISRLDQDISDYLLPFGYQLTHLKNRDRVNTAVLTTPVLPDDGTPVKTLFIHNHQEDLIPTIGPLIRTCLRLSDRNLHPKKLRAVVDCMFTIMCEDTSHDPEESAAKKMAHHIHMIIRNSMGSALCMDLVVLLPFYSSVDRPLSKRAVTKAMENNADTGYTCVTLKERGSEEHTSSNFVSDARNLHVHVETRMCTVRHQPDLYRWLVTSPTASLDSIELDKKTRQSSAPKPSVIACIEKVANLHRILMLCYDYDNKSLHNLEDSKHSSLLLLNMVVVMPRELNVQTSTKTKGKKKIMPKSLLEHFNEAIEHFQSVAFGKNKQQYNFYRPKMIYEDESINRIHFFHAADDATKSVVGIDLHPNALTLDGDYFVYKNLNNSHPEHKVKKFTTTYCAMEKLQNAQAIVFGYESTGIPKCIQKCLNAWVQIPSRSSINVVASMSILFDALY